jgi:hypothetical protein
MASSDGLAFLLRSASLRIFATSYFFYTLEMLKKGHSVWPRGSFRPCQAGAG